jgi:sugar/nucleoside kinase (ribokinase family)
LDGRLRLRNELVRLQQSDEQVEQLGLKRLGFGVQTMPYESRVVESTVDEFDRRLSELQEARLAKEQEAQLELQRMQTEAGREEKGGVAEEEGGRAEEDPEQQLMNEFMLAVNEQHLERENWRRLTHTALCETFPQQQHELKCLSLSPTVDKSCQSGESISFPGVVSYYYHYTFSVDVDGLPIHPAQAVDGIVEELELQPEAGEHIDQSADDSTTMLPQAAQEVEAAAGAVAEGRIVVAEGGAGLTATDVGSGMGQAASALSSLFSRDGYFCTYKNIGGTAQNPRWTKCVWQWYEEEHATTVLNKSKQAAGTPFFVKTASVQAIVVESDCADDAAAAVEAAASAEYECNLPFELWTIDEARHGLEDLRRSGGGIPGGGNIQLMALTAGIVRQRLTQAFHFDPQEADAILEAALGEKKSKKALAVMASFRKPKAGKDKQSAGGSNSNRMGTSLSNNPLQPAQLRALEVAVQKMRVKVMWKGGNGPVLQPGEVWGGVPLLEELYPRGCRVLAKQVSGGFSGACVFQVRSFNVDGSAVVPTVVKFDALDRIVNELSGLQTMAPLLGDNYPKIMPNGIAPAGQKLEERGYSRRDMFVTGSYNEEAKRSKKAEKHRSSRLSVRKSRFLSAVGEEGEEEEDLEEGGEEEGESEGGSEGGKRAESVASARAASVSQKEETETQTQIETQNEMAAIKMQYVGSAFMLPELIAGGGDDAAAALLTTFTDIFKQHMRLGAMAMTGSGNINGLYGSTNKATNKAVLSNSKGAINSGGGNARDQTQRKSSRAVQFKETVSSALKKERKAGREKREKDRRDKRERTGIEEVCRIAEPLIKEQKQYLEVRQAVERSLGRPMDSSEKRAVQLMVRDTKQNNSSMECEAGDERMDMVLVAVPTQVLADVLEVMQRPTVEMAVKKPMNLFNEFCIQRYLDRFVFKRQQRMEKDYLTGKRVRMENNPTTIDEIEEGAEKWLREFWSDEMQRTAERMEGEHWWGLTHGDLNGNNFMVDTGGIVSVIDFAGSGRGHVLKDLAKLETAILLEYTPLEPDDLPLAKDVVMALYEPSDLQDEEMDFTECRNLDNHPNLQPMVDCLLVLRQYAARYCKDDPSFLAYSIALFAQAIKCTGYIDTSLLHKQLALYAAKLHMKRIKQEMRKLYSNEQDRYVPSKVARDTLSEPLDMSDLTMSDGALGLSSRNFPAMMKEGAAAKRSSAPTKRMMLKQIRGGSSSKAMLQRQASRQIRGGGKSLQKSNRNLLSKSESVSGHGTSAAMSEMAQDHELRKYCLQTLITEGTIIDAISRELVPVERCATMRFIGGKSLDEIEETEANERAEGQTSGGAEMGTERTPNALLDMAQKHDMVLILGDAAAGKSTYMRKCLVAAVHRIKDKLDNRISQGQAGGSAPPSSAPANSAGAQAIANQGRKGDLYPILISALELSAQLRRGRAASGGSDSIETAGGTSESTLDATEFDHGSIDLLDAYLQRKYGKQTPRYRALSAVVAKKQALLIIDGLDEAGDQKDAIEIYLHTRVASKEGGTTGLKVLLSSRLSGFRDKMFLGHDCMLLKLAPLSIQTQDEILRLQLEASDQQQDGKDSLNAKIKHIKQALQTSKPLAQLTGNALMLSLLILVLRQQSVAALEKLNVSTTSHLVHMAVRLMLTTQPREKVARARRNNAGNGAGTEGAAATSEDALERLGSEVCLQLLQRLAYCAHTSSRVELRGADFVAAVKEMKQEIERGVGLGAAGGVDGVGAGGGTGSSRRVSVGNRDSLAPDVEGGADGVEGSSGAGRSSSADKSGPTMQAMDRSEFVKKQLLDLLETHNNLLHAVCTTGIVPLLGKRADLVTKVNSWLPPSQSIASENVGSTSSLFSATAQWGTKGDEVKIDWPDRVVRFSHLTFQEFLAGGHMGTKLKRALETSDEDFEAEVIKLCSSSGSSSPSPAGGSRPAEEEKPEVPHARKSEGPRQKRREVGKGTGRHLLALDRLHDHWWVQSIFYCAAALGEKVLDFVRVILKYDDSSGTNANVCRFMLAECDPRWRESATVIVNEWIRQIRPSKLLVRGLCSASPTLRQLMVEEINTFSIPKHELLRLLLSKLAKTAIATTAFRASAGSTCDDVRDSDGLDQSTCSLGSQDPITFSIGTEAEPTKTQDSGMGNTELAVVESIGRLLVTGGLTVRRKAQLEEEESEKVATVTQAEEEAAERGNEVLSLSVEEQNAVLDVSIRLCTGEGSEHVQGWFSGGDADPLKQARDCAARTITALGLAGHGRVQQMLLKILTVNDAKDFGFLANFVIMVANGLQVVLSAAEADMAVRKGTLIGEHGASEQGQGMGFDEVFDPAVVRELVSSCREGWSYELVSASCSLFPKMSAEQLWTYDAINPAVVSTILQIHNDTSTDYADADDNSAGTRDSGASNFGGSVHGSGGLSVGGRKASRKFSASLNEVEVGEQRVQHSLVGAALDTLPRVVCDHSVCKVQADALKMLLPILGLRDGSMMARATATLLKRFSGTYSGDDGHSMLSPQEGGDDWGNEFGAWLHRHLHLEEDELKKLWTWDDDELADEIQRCWIHGQRLYSVAGSAWDDDIVGYDGQNEDIYESSQTERMRIKQQQQAMLLSTPSTQGFVAGFGSRVRRTMSAISGPPTLNASSVAKLTIQGKSNSSLSGAGSVRRSISSDEDPQSRIKRLSSNVGKLVRDPGSMSSRRRMSSKHVEDGGAASNVSSAFSIASAVSSAVDDPKNMLDERMETSFDSMMSTPLVSQHSLVQQMVAEEVEANFQRALLRVNEPKNLKVIVRKKKDGELQRIEKKAMGQRGMFSSMRHAVKDTVSDSLTFGFGSTVRASVSTQSLVDSNANAHSRSMTIAPSPVSTAITSRPAAQSVASGLKVAKPAKDQREDAYKVQYVRMVSEILGPDPVASRRSLAERNNGSEQAQQMPTQAMPPTKLEGDQSEQLASALEGEQSKQTASALDMQGDIENVAFPQEMAGQTELELELSRESSISNPMMLQSKRPIHMPELVTSDAPLNLPTSTIMASPLTESRQLEEEEEASGDTMPSPQSAQRSVFARLSVSERRQQDLRSPAGPLMIQTRNTASPTNSLDETAPGSAPSSYGSSSESTSPKLSSSPPTPGPPLEPLSPGIGSGRMRTHSLANRQRKESARKVSGTFKAMRERGYSAISGSFRTNPADSNSSTGSSASSDAAAANWETSITSTSSASSSSSTSRRRSLTAGGLMSDRRLSTSPPMSPQIMLDRKSTASPPPVATPATPTLASSRWKMLRTKVVGDAKSAVFTSRQPFSPGSPPLAATVASLPALTPLRKISNVADRAVQRQPDNTQPLSDLAKGFVRESALFTKAVRRCARLLAEEREKRAAETASLVEGEQGAAQDAETTLEAEGDDGDDEDEQRLYRPSIVFFESIVEEETTDRTSALLAQEAMPLSEVDVAWEHLESHFNELVKLDEKRFAAQAQMGEREVEAMVTAMASVFELEIEAEPDTSISGASQNTMSIRSATGAVGGAASVAQLQEEAKDFLLFNVEHVECCPHVLQTPPGRDLFRHLRHAVSVGLGEFDFAASLELLVRFARVDPSGACWTGVMNLLADPEEPPYAKQWVQECLTGMEFMGPKARLETLIDQIGAEHNLSRAFAFEILITHLRKSRTADASWEVPHEVQTCLEELSNSKDNLEAMFLCKEIKVGMFEAKLERAKVELSLSERPVVLHPGSVLVVGSVQMDIRTQLQRDGSTPTAGAIEAAGRLEYLPGGHGANAAVAIKKLWREAASGSSRYTRNGGNKATHVEPALRVYLVGRVGAGPDGTPDEFGFKSLEQLRHYSVDVKGVGKQPNITSGMSLAVVCPLAGEASAKGSSRPKPSRTARRSKAKEPQASDGARSVTSSFVWNGANIFLGEQELKVVKEHLKESLDDIDDRFSSLQSSSAGGHLGGGLANSRQSMTSMSKKRQSVTHGSQGAMDVGGGMAALGGPKTKPKRFSMSMGGMASGHDRISGQLGVHKTRAGSMHLSTGRHTEHGGHGSSGGSRQHPQSPATGEEDVEPFPVGIVLLQLGPSMPVLQLAQVAREAKEQKRTVVLHASPLEDSHANARHRANTEHPSTPTSGGAGVVVAGLIQYGLLQNCDVLFLDEWDAPALLRSTEPSAATNINASSPGVSAAPAERSNPLSIPSPLRTLAHARAAADEIQRLYHPPVLVISIGIASTPYINTAGKRQDRPVGQGQGLILCITRDKDCFTVPVLPMPRLVDDIGAMDVFVGGFVNAIATKCTIREALVRGMCCACYSTQNIGAQSSFPDLPKLEAFIERKVPDLQNHYNRESLELGHQYMRVQNLVISPNTAISASSGMAANVLQLQKVFAGMDEGTKKMVPNWLDFQGQSLVHLAVLAGRLDVLKVLCEQECLADAVRDEDDYGFTPLQRALECRQGFEACLSGALPAVPPLSTKDTPVTTAAVQLQPAMSKDEMPLRDDHRLHVTYTAIIRHFRRCLDLDEDDDDNKESSEEGSDDFEEGSEGEDEDSIRMTSTELFQTSMHGMGSLASAASKRFSIRANSSIASGRNGSLAGPRLMSRVSRGQSNSPVLGLHGKSFSRMGSPRESADSPRSPRPLSAGAGVDFGTGSASVRAAAAAAAATAVIGVAVVGVVSIDLIIRTSYVPEPRVPTEDAKLPAAGLQRGLQQGWQKNTTSLMSALAKDEGDSGGALMSGVVLKRSHVVRAEAMSHRAGGQGAEQASAMALLGTRVALVSHVGRDEFGERMIAMLIMRGVDMSCVDTRKEDKTETTVLIQSSEAQPCRISCQFGADGSERAVRNLRQVEKLLENDVTGKARAAASATEASEDGKTSPAPQAVLGGLYYKYVQLQLGLLPLERVYEVAALAKKLGRIVVLHASPLQTPAAAAAALAGGGDVTDVPTGLLSLVDILFVDEWSAVRLLGNGRHSSQFWRTNGRDGTGGSGFEPLGSLREAKAAAIEIGHRYPTLLKTVVSVSVGPISDRESSCSLADSGDAGMRMSNLLRTYTTADVTGSNGSGGSNNNDDGSGSSSSAHLVNCSAEGISAISASGPSLQPDPQPEGRSPHRSSTARLPPPTPPTLARSVKVGVGVSGDDAEVGASEGSTDRAATTAPGSGGGRNGDDNKADATRHTFVSAYVSALVRVDEAARVPTDAFLAGSAAYPKSKDMLRWATCAEAVVRNAASLTNTEPGANDSVDVDGATGSAGAADAVAAATNPAVSKLRATQARSASRDILRGGKHSSHSLDGHSPSMRDIEGGKVNGATKSSVETYIEQHEWGMEECFQRAERELASDEYEIGFDEAVEEAKGADEAGLGLGLGLGLDAIDPSLFDEAVAETQKVKSEVKEVAKEGKETAVGVGSSVLSGVLYKRGDKRQNWKERYFVLDRERLAWYAEEGGPMKGQLRLQGANCVTLEVMPDDLKKTGNSASSSWRFRITSADSSRRLVMAATTEDGLYHWCAGVVIVAGVGNLVVDGKGFEPEKLASVSKALSAQLEKGHERQRWSRWLRERVPWCRQDMHTLLTGSGVAMGPEMMAAADFEGLAFAEACARVATRRVVEVGEFLITGEEPAAEPKPKPKARALKGAKEAAVLPGADQRVRKLHFLLRGVAKQVRENAPPTMHQSGDVLVELASNTKPESSGARLLGGLNKTIQLHLSSNPAPHDIGGPQWPWPTVAVERCVVLTVEGSALEAVLASYQAKAIDALAIGLLRHDEDGRVLVQRLRGALVKCTIDGAEYEQHVRAALAARAAGEW